MGEYQMAGADVLWALARASIAAHCGDADPRHWRQFVEAFLDFAWGTEENVAAIERLCFGDVPNPASPDCCWVGVRFRETEAHIEDLFYDLEECDVPEPIKAKYGTLSYEEWQAAMRLAAMVFSATTNCGIRKKAGDEEQ